MTNVIDAPRVLEHLALVDNGTVARDAYSGLIGRKDYFQARKVLEGVER